MNEDKEAVLEEIQDALPGITLTFQGNVKNVNIHITHYNVSESEEEE